MQTSISGPSLLDIGRAVWRHKGKVALVTLISTLAAVALLAAWPRKYRSEAGLFVRVGRESVSLDPTATMGQNISVQDSRETELNSVLGVLRSRAVSEAVVDRLGADVVLGKVPPQTGAGAASNPSGDAAAAAGAKKSSSMLTVAVRSLMDWLRLRDPITEREEAIRSVSESLGIDVVRKSSVVVVAARADNPALAQTLTQGVVDAYGDIHLKLHHTPGSMDFFQQQYEDTRNALADAEEALRNAKDRGGLVSLLGQQQVLETEVSLIESSLVTAQATRAAAEGRVTALKESTTKLEPTVLAQEVGGINNEALDRIQEKLYELRILEQNHLAKYSPDHPLLKAIRDQVDGAQALLAEQPKSRVESTKAMNPNLQKLDLDMRTAEGEMLAMDKQIEALEGQHAKAIERLRQLNEQAVEISRREREVAVLSDRLRKYAENHEQARIDSALEAQRISNVNIFQPATYSDRPISPKKPLVLGGGVLFGLLAGTILATVWEMRYGKVHSATDLGFARDLPVVVGVPRGPRQRVTVS